MLHGPPVQVGGTNGFPFLGISDQIDDAGRGEFADRIGRVFLGDEGKFEVSPFHTYISAPIQ